MCELEGLVVDASGLPLGLETAAVDVSEQQLLMPALDEVPVALPPDTPVIADKGHDSDALRDALEAEQLVLIIPPGKTV